MKTLIMALVALSAVTGISPIANALDPKSFYDQQDRWSGGAVVHHGCAAANYTVAHEVGHLIGARHDLSYVNGTKWRDIMSVRESCGGCPRVPVWSSPMVLVNGERAGTAELDNARVIAEQAARVSQHGAARIAKLVGDPRPLGRRDGRRLERSH